MDVDLKNRWEVLLGKLTNQFRMEANLESVLFLIGIQEFGKIPEKLSKHQKVEVMHIAICSLLSEFGYYTYLGEDKEGWPHWERNKKLPNLSDEEQDFLIKKSIIRYFDSNGYFKEPKQ